MRGGARGSPVAGFSRPFAASIRVARVFILVRTAGPAGCERRRRVVVVVVGRVDLVAGGECDDGEGVPLQPALVSVGQFLRVMASRGSGRARETKKTTSGGYFLCFLHGSSPASAILRGPQPSSPRPSGRRASSSCGCCPSREPDGIGGKGAGFNESSGSTPRQFRWGGQSSKDVCDDIWRQTPRATGRNGPGLHSSSEDAGVGRGKGRRGSPSVAVTARVSSIDQMSICGWVPEGFRPRAEARRRPDPRVVSTCLHYWLPANEGPRRKHGTGARLTWVCLRSRGSPSSSKSSPAAFSFHSDAITIADDARECYRERHLGAKATEESSSSRARQRNGRKRTCVNKASPRFYRAGRRLSGRLLSASNVDGSLVNNAGESHSATAPSLWGTAFNKSASSRTNNASNVRLSGDNAATTEICKSFFWFLARAPYVCAPSLGFGWEKAEKTTREHWNKNRDICAF